MHELSLCKNILFIARQYVVAPYSTIKYIYLEIGVFAIVEKPTLKFNFDILKKGTVAHDAILKIIDIDGEGTCNICQKKVIMNTYYMKCPVCQKNSLIVTRGQELKIRSIEVL